MFGSGERVTSGPCDRVLLRAAPTGQDTKAQMRPVRIRLQKGELLDDAALSQNL